MQVTDVMNGQGHVAFMKLGFTNPDYLNVFAECESRRDRRGQVVVVKA